MQNTESMENVDFKLFNAALIIKAALNNLKSTFIKVITLT